MLGDYCTVKMEKDDMVNMLYDRVCLLTSDPKEQDLIYKMYENLVYCDAFEGCEFNVMAIVDNDYVNYCDIIREGDDDFEKIKKKFLEEEGRGDISEETHYGFIEAVDNEEEPTMFLVRG